MAICEDCADALDDTSVLTLADHVCEGVDAGECDCRCQRITKPHLIITIPESQQADVTVVNHGSIVMLHPNTEEAIAWVNDHIGEANSYQPSWPSVLCEPRYVQAIIDGMEGDGLTVDA